MEGLFEELREKIKSTDTNKLNDIQQELVKAKEKNEINDDEFHRLKKAIGERLDGYNV